MGFVLHDSGRAPFPLVEGMSACPQDSSTTFPPDNLFPLPLPELPPVEKSGRKRERSLRRREEVRMLAGIVAAVNTLSFGAHCDRACFPKGLPASAAQYRCLNQLFIPLRGFLRGLIAARLKASRSQVPDPAS